MQQSLTRWLHSAGCPSGVQRVISFDPLLLPPENVNASSEDVETNPDDKLFGRNNVPFNLWCSAPSAGLQHSITVTLAEPAVLTGIISSGFSNGHVSNFTLEYAIGPDNYTLYEDQKNEKVSRLSCINNLPFCLWSSHFCSTF